MDRSKKLGNKLEQRIYISGNLCFEHSFHVGSGNSSIETDSLLFRDVMGEIIIPGTSMCGALKNHLAKNYITQNDIIRKYFGNTDDKEISRVFVDDLYPEGRQLLSRVRDGVAIRRDYGTARKRAKYDYEISARQSKLLFRMMIEFRKNDSDSEDMQQLIKTLLHDMQDGRILVGGNKTRGLGRFKLKDITVTKFIFPDNLKELLLNGSESAGKKITMAEISKEECLPPETVTHEISIVCSIKDPLLIKDGLRSEADTFVETVEQDSSEQKKETDAYFVKIINRSGNEERVIPGASIKGVFRTRAEKIIRTLGFDEDACDPTAPDEENRCIIKIKDALKKLMEQKEAGKLTEKKLTEDRFETIQKESCFICRLFGNTYLASRIFFSDSKIDNAGLQKFDGVAINRFTSGPVDAALFDAMPLIKGDFTINITAHNITDSETALLLFVLRDFKDNVIPISLGFGKNKGYGAFNVEKIDINGLDYKKYLTESIEKNIFKDWQDHWENKKNEHAEAL